MARLLTPEDVATQVGVTVKTIYNWRARRPAYGPPAFKVGKYLRWKPEVVQAWIDAQEVADPMSERDSPMRTPRPLWGS